MTQEEGFEVDFSHLQPLFDYLRENISHIMFDLVLQQDSVTHAGKLEFENILETPQRYCPNLLPLLCVFYPCYSFTSFCSFFLPLTSLDLHLFLPPYCWEVSGTVYQLETNYDFLCVFVMHEDIGHFKCSHLGS